jgi:GH25 family lysozyme M1 (1,4-beta-N-acetylmuramidase)
MALGIDIYRYQTVTDWNAVKRHGVSFVYVKGTDGGGPAIVRADSQVRGAQSVGVPVGLYHYAQLSPSPEVQADVLTGEVRRLGADGLPPALDLEEPHKAGPAARDFARRFIARMRANGFEHVTLYANTSMLTGIGAWTDYDNDPGVVIWAAAYGPNDGRRHPLNYRGRVNIHQYTSVGRVPGISGDVDLNELLIPVASKGSDMELTDKIRFWDGFEITVGQAMADNWQLANNLSNRPTRPGQPADPAPWITQLFTELAVLRTEVAAARGELAGHGELLRQIAADEELDLDAIQERARLGARQGVAESTIDVDINVAGQMADSPPVEGLDRAGR